MQKKKLLFPLALLLVISLIVVGCTTPEVTQESSPTETSTSPVAEGPVELIEASWPPTEMPPPINKEAFYFTLTEWMDSIEQQTDNQVAFERYPAESLVKMQDAWGAVKKGVCDITIVNVCAFPGQFPMTAALRVPGFFANSVQGAMVRQTLFDEGYLAPEWADVKVLWFGDNAPHSIACRTKQITAIEDLKGLKVANMGEPESSFLEALGAISVAMPASEFYLALERGTVDAVVQDTNGMVAFQLYEVAPYITEIPGNANSSMAIVMNRDKYDSLPPDVKGLFDESTGLLRAICHGMRFDYSVDKCREHLNARENVPSVHVLSADERAKLFETVQPLIDESLAELEDQGMPARDMFERAHELVELYSSWGF
ncbi:MAG: TRAP transporter substrate-binding protein DctP [Dehalococcoidia bacterium]